MSTRGALAPRPVPHPDRRPRERPRPRAVPASRRRRRFRLRIRLGLAVIPLVALLFGGVVWLNAAKLSVTKQQGHVARKAASVQEQLSQLKSAQAQWDTKVRTLAEKQGMTRPGSSDWTYLPARLGR